MYFVYLASFCLIAACLFRDCQSAPVEASLLKLANVFFVFGRNRSLKSGSNMLIENDATAESKTLMEEVFAAKPDL